MIPPMVTEALPDMDSHQLILSTAINGGILALALALFDVGGFWPWLPVGVAALGVILVLQMRHAYRPAAIASALFPRWARPRRQRVIGHTRPSVRCTRCRCAASTCTSRSSGT